MGSQEGIQLAGDRLDRVRRHTQAAHDSLAALAELISKELGFKCTADEVTEYRLVPNNLRLIVHYANGECGVNEDPPGVCRMCVAGE